nr:hypothetical protein [Tanacetum cinerariifolium]
VQFHSHDPVVHHSGHDIKRRVEVNVSLLDMHVSDIALDLKESVEVLHYKFFRCRPFYFGFFLARIVILWDDLNNITPPSSSLVQTSSALGGGGTYPSNSKSELNLRTFSVRNEIDGSGGVEELEWLSGLSLSLLPHSLWFCRQGNSFVAWGGS